MSKPIKVFRCGSIHAAIWREAKQISGNLVQTHTIRFTRSYKTNQGWKSTEVFYPDDLLKM